MSVHFSINYDISLAVLLYDKIPYSSMTPLQAAVGVVQKV